MKKKIKLALLTLIGGFFIGALGTSTPLFAQNNGGNFSTSLEKSTESIGAHLDKPETSLKTEDQAKRIIKKIIDVLFPVILIVGIFVAMLGFYNILTSSSEGKFKSGIHMIVYGVIGIIIMYSAKYLTNVIFIDLFKSGNIPELYTTDLIKIMYDKIAFPFIKIAIYLSLGILVILMMIRVFSYITAQDADTKKKSIGIISRTTIGMLIIIAAKQIVEAIYGKQEQVLKNHTTNLSQIGNAILNPKEIPIIFSILNRALGLVAFVLLILILVQTYKMLTKPDDAETFKSLKKTIAYALGGILLIGSAYLLANLLIFN